MNLMYGMYKTINSYYFCDNHNLTMPNVHSIEWLTESMNYAESTLLSKWGKKCVSYFAKEIDKKTPT